MGGVSTGREGGGCVGVCQQGEGEEGVWAVCQQGEGEEDTQEGRIKYVLQPKNLPSASRKLSQFPPDQ